MPKNEIIELETNVKRRTRPDKAVQTEPGDNTKYLSHNLTIYSWGKVDLQNPEAVEQRIQDYFSLCTINDMKPSMAGMSLALGIDRRRLWELVNETSKFAISKPRETLDTLKRAHDALNAQMEDYMQNGKINPVAGIFLMKNNMGYRDTQDLIVEPRNAQYEGQEIDVIQSKYKELPEE